MEKSVPFNEKICDNVHSKIRFVSDEKCLEEVGKCMTIPLTTYTHES